MSTLRQVISLLRNLGLIHLVDSLNYRYQLFANWKKNHAFKRENPDVALPPDYMLFEAFKLNYKNYFEGGKTTANWVVGILQKHKKLENITFLDWGCGPARVSRHLPPLLGPNAEVFGTDYNPTTIDWCTKSIQNVNFSLNGIKPPLNYPSAKFDAILGISIFTHLSENRHHAWVEELHRVVKPGGVLLLTTQGIAYREKLTEQEKKVFDCGMLVVRTKAKEGHRVFSAFHPPALVRQLFEPYFSILEHQEGQLVHWGIEQDYWVLQKRA